MSLADILSLANITPTFAGSLSALVIIVPCAGMSIVGLFTMLLAGE